MPHVFAAVVRSEPSSTMAKASIRRAAAPFVSLAAAARSAVALKSSRVIAIAAAIEDLPPKKAASIQTFADSRIPHESVFLAVGMRRRDRNSQMFFGKERLGQVEEAALAAKARSQEQHGLPAA